MEIEIKDFFARAGTTESVAGAIVLVAAVYLLQSFFLNGPNLSHIPLAGEEFGSKSRRLKEMRSNSKNWFRDQYKKNSSVWRIQTTDYDHVQIPLKFVDDIKARKDEEVSSLAALDIVVQKKYSGMDSSSAMMTHLVKSDLTTALNRINPNLGVACKEAVESEFPACEEWTALNVNDKLVRIIAIISGYIFLGPELCHNEEYISLSTGFTVDAFTCVFILAALPWWSRHIVKWAIPHYYKIAAYKKRAIKFLGPIIKDRKEKMKDPDWERPDDILQWTINKAEKWPEIRNDGDIAIMQLRLSLAAIHTTSTTTTALLYDVVTVPGLIEELRKEIDEVLENHDNVMSNKALYDMKLLDSVMKESQRVNPIGITGFQRYTLKDITLPDGTNIPPHTFIEAPIEAIHRDPERYDNPDVFDPYRFYNMRKQDDSAGKHQYVTLSTDVLSFGIGKHACPGRFFAANEIKMIMVNLLRRFDIEQKEKGPRYENIAHWIQNAADTKRELMFRRSKA